MSRTSRWTPDDVLPHRGWTSVGGLGGSPWDSPPAAGRPEVELSPARAVDELLQAIDEPPRLPPDRRPTELDGRRRGEGRPSQDEASSSILGASLLDPGVGLAEGDELVTEVSHSAIALPS